MLDMLTWMIVCACAAIIARRALAAMQGKKACASDGCGSCKGCPLKSARYDFVSIGETKK